MNKKFLSVITTLIFVASILFPTASGFAASTTAAPASTYGIKYEAHVAYKAWLPAVTATGDQYDISQDLTLIAGTVAESRRMEALKLTVINLPAEASITIRAHVAYKGWLDPVTVTGNQDISQVPIAGTTHESRQMEAVKITLKGMPGYAVKYQAHVAYKGWLDPVTVNNGTDINDADKAGTVAESRQMEALRIEIVKTDTEKAAEVTAIDAVTKAEGTKTIANVTAATTAIQAVKDTVENSSLTAKINAIDVTAPVITLTGAATVNVANGAIYTDTGATATDNKDVNVTVTKVIKDASGATLTAIDTKVAGTYTITYSAKDGAGNVAQDVVRTVVVVPLTISAITVTGTAQVNSVLTATGLLPTGATASYQWKISTDGITYANITGATTNKYTPVAGDVNKFIKVVATGTGNYTGTVTSTATVTVPAYVAPVPVEVTAINVTGAGNAITVTNGSTLQMNATVTPDTATNKTVTWTVATLSGGTATIDATTGILTGTGVGTVRVTATNAASGVTGTKDITVTAAEAALVLAYTNATDAATFVTLLDANALTSVFVKIVVARI